VVTAEFQAGLPMNIASNENNQIRYQPRGHAKYIDIARVFGWESIIAFFRAFQLIYEAFKIHADPQDSVSEQRQKYHRTKWPWKKIIKVMSQAGSLEAVDWDEVATFFAGPADNEEDMMSENTEVNIALYSLATDSNLLTYLEFWGVNGIDNDGRTKINELVGHLNTFSLCNVYTDYESFIPQNQHDLTAHIQRQYANYIISVDPDTHVIEWHSSVFYKDERYGVGYYAHHYLYDADYAAGIEDARKRLLPLKIDACDKNPTPSPSTTNCSENSSEKFLYKKNKKGKYVTKTCGWLKDKGTKINICKNKVAATEKYDSPQYTCRVSCNSCDRCYENENSRFFYKKNKKSNKVILKNCKWLKNKRDKINAICKKNITNGGYGPAKKVCPMVCDASCS